MKKLRLLVTDPKLFIKKVLIKLHLIKPNPIKAHYQFNPFERYTHMIHTGENVTGLSHLDLWIPQFLLADIDMIVMTRNHELFEAVKAKYPQISILYAKGAGEVRYYMERLIELKACFYPSNTGNNLHLLMQNQIQHIFIGHGDSDKTASAHKYFRVYDENWVAGEAHIDRFRNEGFDFSGLKQVKVGRPSLEDTLKHSETPWIERFEGELRLLYLSTWEGFFKEQNYTSAYMMRDFFEEMHEKNIFDRIDVKLHPWIGRRDESLLLFPKWLTELFQSGDTQATVHDKGIPVETLIKGSNVFICDISAVISESLAADGPIFVYIPKDTKIRLTQSKMMYGDYAYTFSTTDELVEKIEEVILKHNDYLADKRKEAMEYILGRDETLQEEFIKKLKEL